MALITRRSFARQTVFGAALWAGPLRALGGSRGLVDADKQSDAPLDAELIRKLSSHIVGRVITPASSDYDASRSVFNSAGSDTGCAMAAL